MAFADSILDLVPAVNIIYGVCTSPPGPTPQCGEHVMPELVDG